MKEHIRLVVAFIVLVQHAQSEACIPYPEKAVCYKLIKSPRLDWWSARKECRKLGGDLAMLKEFATTEFIDKNLILFEGVWIGLWNAIQNYKWVDGTAMVYSNWKAGEPNSNNAYCVERMAGGKWNDLSCRVEQSYLCELEMTEEQPYPRWKDELLELLLTIFQETKQNDEELLRVFFYIDAQDEAYRHTTETAPVWNKLKSVARNKNMFKIYVNTLVEETKEAGRDRQFREAMRDWNPNSGNEYWHDEAHEGFDSSNVDRNKFVRTFGIFSLIRAWDYIPKNYQTTISTAVSKIVAYAPATLKEKVTAVNVIVGGTGSYMATIKLFIVYLSDGAVWNIYQWCNGFISGKRCVKNIVKDSVNVAGSAGGGVIGAMLGNFIFPGPGGAIGGVIGGAFGWCGASKLNDKLSRIFFDLTRDVNLENAYNFLDLCWRASNDEVNKAYHKLCKRYHPDKRHGSKEMFLKLQYYMQIIKSARGEKPY